jgi:membrane fusion protein, protease secretion system
MTQAESSIQLYKEASDKAPSATDIAASSIDTDLTKYIRLGWWIVIGGLGSFLVWASLAPLDKGVPLTGTVAVASSKKAIQHEAGGTVEAILVKEGGLVKAGDVLIRMNSIQAGADAETARVQYIAARTMQARLEAERDGKSSIALPKEFAKEKKDPRVLENIALQKQISSSRQSAIRSELSAIDENVAGLISQMQGLEESVASKREQKALITEQLSGMRDLAKEGYMATNRVLETEQTLAGINADISADIGNIGRSKRQISELKLQKIQRNQEYQKEVRTQLSEAQKQADALQNQLKGLDRNVQNIEIKAPVAGTVVGLSVFTTGAVVAPGFKLMDIVPVEDSLVVEGQLPVHLVDKVYPGLPVNLIFTAFNQNKTPHIPGEVVTVSADRFIEEQTGQPYYKVTSKVAPEGVKMIYNLKIRPGMPVDMFVKTGERTMMNYLLRPILDHLKLSMSEE